MSKEIKLVSVVTQDGSVSSNREEDNCYNRLVTEGYLTAGDHGIAPKDIPLDWVDPDLVKKGQEYFRKNFIGCSIAAFLGLVIGFSGRRGASLLRRTGYFDNKETVISRYLGLAHHIILWLESDLLESLSKGSQDIYATRKVHSAALRAYNREDPFPELPPLSEKSLILLEAIRKDLADVDDSELQEGKLASKFHYHPINPMSQLDMAAALTALYIILVFVPKKFGARDDPEGLRAYLHVWALLGKLLGMEDKFNPALHHEDGVTTETIMNDCYLALLKNCDEYAMTIWDATFSSFSRYTSLLRAPIVLCYLVQNLDRKERYEAKNIYATLTTYEKCLLKIAGVLMKISVNVWVVYVCMNFLALKFSKVLLKTYVWKYGSPTTAITKKA